MKRALAVILALGMTACGGDGGSGTGPEPLPSALIGSWVARPDCVPECGFTFYDPAAPADSTNFTVSGNQSLLVLSADRFSFELDTRGTAKSDSIGGGIHVEGNTLVTAAGDRIDYTLQGNRLILNWRNAFTVGNTSARARGAFLKQ